MLQNLFSIRQFWLTKWSFLVHSTTRNAPYLHPSHDSRKKDANKIMSMLRACICMLMLSYALIWY